jgi:hypothetical protein
MRPISAQVKRFSTENAGKRSESGLSNANLDFLRSSSDKATKVWSQKKVLNECHPSEYSSRRSTSLPQEPHKVVNRFPGEETAMDPCHSGSVHPYPLSLRRWCI